MRGRRGCIKWGEGRRGNSVDTRQWSVLCWVARVYICFRWAKLEWTGEDFGGTKVGEVLKLPAKVKVRRKRRRERERERESKFGMLDAREWMLWVCRVNWRERGKRSRELRVWTCRGKRKREVTSQVTVWVGAAKDPQKGMLKRRRILESERERRAKVTLCVCWFVVSSKLQLFPVFSVCDFGLLFTLFSLSLSLSFSLSIYCRVARGRAKEGHLEFSVVVLLFKLFSLLSCEPLFTLTLGPHPLVTSRPEHLLTNSQWFLSSAIIINDQILAQTPNTQVAGVESVCCVHPSNFFLFLPLLSFPENWPKRVKSFSGKIFNFKF